MVLKSAKFILEKYPKFKPRISIILGSGLGSLCEKIDKAAIIPYTKIPSYPPCGVDGHMGQLYLGYLHGIAVACLQGRIHLYEGISNADIKIFIRTLKLIGSDTLIVTNAAGSLNRDITPGQLVLIKDHINLQFNNPLIGPNEDEFGPRFFDMSNVYDLTLQQHFLEAAKKANLTLHRGVFAGVLGPSFETPAEIEMIRRLGADTVAMSLIPEVLVAKHCGMKVAAISAISNLASGLHPKNEELSHAVTLEGAKKASNNLISLISKFLETYAEQLKN